MTTEQAVVAAVLDSEIAEKLFGWREAGDGTLRPSWFVTLEERGENPILSPTLSAYSTTGDGMLIVLHTMKEHGWLFVIVTMTDGRFEVQFWREGQSEHHFFGNNDSLPTAVAIAALAALEAA